MTGRVECPLGATRTVARLSAPDTAARQPDGAIWSAHVVFAAVVLAAYLVAYPAFAWTYLDLRRYPRRLWTGYGNPHRWRQATDLAYLAGGLPVFAVAVAWRTSTTRAELRSVARRSRGDEG